MAPSRIAESVGRVLGERYRLTRPLGSGATAAVFMAEDVKLRRRVAVKVLHPGLATEEAFLRRFRREAQAVASLNHPNILNVYDWGDESGDPYLVMELLEGGTLRSMLDRGALLSAAQAAAVGAGAAAALAHAHRQGLVHRDIKPANLIFDLEGHVHVADFGLARAVAEASLTEPNGAVVGTARYSSPELVRGEHLDPKSDVYSLALVLVEAMTGSVPFAADTAVGSLMARLGRSLEPPVETGPLAVVISAAGAVDVTERIGAAELARQLEQVAAHLPYPAPLSLALAGSAGLDGDEVDPTVLPGRPRLYDDEMAPPAPDALARPSAARRPIDRRGQRVPDHGDYRDHGDGQDHVAVPRRRRRLVLAIVAALVLLIAAAAAYAVTSGAFVPDEPVPGLTGLNPAAARAAVVRDHLELAVTGQQYSSKPAGVVLSQSPAGGHLKRGAAVDVVLSKGPAPVPVPAVVGDSLNDAETALRGFGINWHISQASSMTVAPGSIISTSPSSGSATIVPGSYMNLVVSTGKPTVPVPAITAGTEPATTAEVALRQAGLADQVATQYSNSVAKGAVISVSPAPGAQAQVGSVVTLTVSEGPHYVTVPPTNGDSVGSATEALGSDGFNVDGVDGSPIGTVAGTDPAAGQQVLYGSSIVIITH